LEKLNPVHVLVVLLFAWSGQGSLCYKRRLLKVTSYLMFHYALQQKLLKEVRLASDAAKDEYILDLLEPKNANWPWLTLKDFRFNSFAMEC